jgi:hypothetical protein
LVLATTSKELVTYDTDGVLHLNLNPAQQAVDLSDKRFTCLFAGTQGGKTSYAPWWLWDRIQESAKPDELNDYLVVTATYPLMNLKLLPAFVEVFQEILKIGTLRVTEKVIYFKYKGAKGRIIFCSAENPESMESATAKAAVLDECGQVQFKREAWEAVRRRLSLYRGRVLLITTLYTGGGWLKTDFYDHWKKQDEIGQEIDIFQFPSTVNPKFSQEEYDSARMSLPDWKFKLLYMGEFANAVGLVYDSFNTDICMKSRKDWPVQNTWPRYVGMDFGNDTAAVFIAVDPGTGYKYADREYLVKGLSTKQHVDNLKEMSKNWTIVKCVGGKGDKGDEGWLGDFTKAGWPVQMPYIRSVEIGISRVYAFHKSNQYFICSDLYDLLREKQSYSYKLDNDNQATGDIENKQRYHLMDSERGIFSTFAVEGIAPSKIKLRSYGVRYGN